MKANSVCIIAVLTLGGLPHLQAQEDPELPTIITPPERQILRPGDPLVLSVEAVGQLPLSYQWYRNAVLLEGETQATFTVDAVSEEDEGKYYVTVTNDLDTVYSAHTRVSVRPLNLDKSIARQWNDEILDAIRQDYPAPTVHSRNLFSLSIAMWDAWAAYDQTGNAIPYLTDENPEAPGTPAEALAARNEAISYAAFRLLTARYRWSPSAGTSLASFRTRMEILGYDPDNTIVTGDSPAAVGNRIAALVLAYHWTDGANEKDNYEDQTGYGPRNIQLVVSEVGTKARRPNAWQPLGFSSLVLQNGIVVGEAVQEFLGPNWGWVTPFALTRENDDAIYSDPGPPPYLGDPVTDMAYKMDALEVVDFQSWHDPNVGDGTQLIDVSPRSRHNNPLGTNDGTGYDLNPVTGEPYEENLVLLADYGRILAEFWADGPDSETPPGHWNSIANRVTNDELFERRFEGAGDELDDLEWDVKMYFCLNAALSDAAIACWDAKRKYDYARPITMIRYMAEQGQSSNPELPSYDVEGLPIVEGLSELITAESSAPGQRHEHLAEYVGEMALYTWRGVPENPNTEIGGVGWMRALEWMPYQRPTFVSPPFGGYTSGHSTFSRAAAEVMAAITGTPYFPGGISSFTVRANEFLEFERGPENDVTLTWATYYDAADEAGISRLYGGIHVRADDFGGRIMGADIGQQAFAKARTYFDGTAQTIDFAASFDTWVADMLADPNQLNDLNYYIAQPYEAMAAFFFGDDPLAPEKHTRISFTVDDETGHVRMRFVTETTIALRTWELDVSSDLTVWTPIENEFVEVLETPLGNGRVLVTITDTSASYGGTEARFYQVRTVLPEDE